MKTFFSLIEKADKQQKTIRSSSNSNQTWVSFIQKKQYENTNSYKLIDNYINELSTFENIFKKIQTDKNAKNPENLKKAQELVYVIVDAIKQNYTPNPLHLQLAFRINEEELLNVISEKLENCFPISLVGDKTHRESLKRAENLQWVTIVLLNSPVNFIKLNNGGQLFKQINAAATFQSENQDKELKSIIEDSCLADGYEDLVAWPREKVQKTTTSDALRLVEEFEGKFVKEHHTSISNPDNLEKILLSYSIHSSGKVLSEFHIFASEIINQGEIANMQIEQKGGPLKEQDRAEQKLFEDQNTEYHSRFRYHYVKDILRGSYLHSNPMQLNCVIQHVITTFENDSRVLNFRVKNGYIKEPMHQMDLKITGCIQLSKQTVKFELQFILSKILECKETLHSVQDVTRNESLFQKVIDKSSINFSKCNLI